MSSPTARTIAEEDLAEIEYLGTTGETEPCLEEIQLILMQRPRVSRAAIISFNQRHGFLLALGEYRHVAIKPGFASGYSGEGPNGLSQAILTLHMHGAEVLDAQVPSELMDRLKKSCLTRDDITRIMTYKYPREPWSDYIIDNHWELRRSGELWRNTPLVMPFPLLDSRLIDLAIGFWNDPDAALMKGFRRLEATVRERSGLKGEGVKLFKAAFFSDDAPLRWPDLHAAEQDARANLIAGVFGAFRNPRMHQELEHSPANQLSEFLLINKLFRLESEAVNAKDE